jgi:hypothetical protein
LDPGGTIWAGHQRLRFRPALRWLLHALHACTHSKEIWIRIPSFTLAAPSLGGGPPPPPPTPIVEADEGVDEEAAAIDERRAEESARRDPKSVAIAEPVEEEGGAAMSDVDGPPPAIDGPARTPPTPGMT